MKMFFEKVRDGMGIALGMIIMFGVIFSVYAFVEPSSGPSGSYLIDWASPLNKMHNDTYQDVSSVPSLTANNGMYDNRIVNSTFPAAYTEICFKNGNVYNDSHSGGESTEGGNCLPGDVGYVIEQNERTNATWEDAKATCLKIGMRLPESFEFKFACDNASSFILSDMTGNFEWASNNAIPFRADWGSSSYSVSIVVSALGETQCYDSNFGFIAYHSSTPTITQSTLVYRCVR